LNSVLFNGVGILSHSPSNSVVSLLLVELKIIYGYTNLELPQSRINHSSRLKKIVYVNLELPKPRLGCLGLGLAFGGQKVEVIGFESKKPIFNIFFHLKT
jgi:hypothetical protein